MVDLMAAQMAATLVERMAGLRVENWAVRKAVNLVEN